MASSRRPYLIRAIYDWVLDNSFTPYLLVAADEPNVEVPRQYVGEDGKIVMNLSPTAVRNLDLSNEMITFEARFSGTPHSVFIPTGAVLAIYAKESGEGMLFGDPEAAFEGAPEDEAPVDAVTDADVVAPPNGDDEPDDSPPAGRKHGHLTVIK